MTARVTTLLSIAGGGLLGALAAMYGRSPPPQIPRASPPLTVAQTAPVEPEPDEPEPPPELPDAEPGSIVDSSTTPSADAETLCGVKKNPRACLEASRTYESSDPAKARAFRLLALSQFIELCTARDPEACIELAALYDRGMPAPENAESPMALRARARKLCEERPTPFCERMR